MYTAVPRIFHNTLTGLLMCAVEDLPFVHSVRGEGTGGGQRKDPRVPSVNIRPTPVCFEFLQLSVQRGGRCWHTFRFCVSRKCCLLLMGPSSSWWQSVKLKSDQTKVREQFSLSGQEARLKWRIAPTTWPFLISGSRDTAWWEPRLRQPRVARCLYLFSWPFSKGIPSPET